MVLVPSSHTIFQLAHLVFTAMAKEEAHFTNEAARAGISGNLIEAILFVCLPCL